MVSHNMFPFLLYFLKIDRQTLRFGQIHVLLFDVYFTSGIVHPLLHHIRRYITSIVPIFVISGLRCSQSSAPPKKIPRQPVTKWFQKHRWSFPGFMRQQRLQNSEGLVLAFLLHLLAGISFIKQTICLSTLWLTQITGFQERQNKCVFLYLYQPIIWMNLCPHILKSGQRGFWVLLFPIILQS